MIENIIRRAGFARSSDHRIGPLWDSKHYFVTQAELGRGLYNQRMRADFFVSGADGFPNGLVIESRAQHTNGTADEKLAYIVKQAECGHYGSATVVVVFGGIGARSGATDWVRKQGHAVMALSLAEFVAWATAELRRDDANLAA